MRYNIEKAAKTGNWKFMKPVLDEKKCVGCGTCVQFCPEACIEMADNDRRQLAARKKRIKIEIDYDWCKGCGVCAAVCLARAVIMKKNKQ